MHYDTKTNISDFQNIDLKKGLRVLMNQRSTRSLDTHESGDLIYQIKQKNTNSSVKSVPSFMAL